MTRIIADSTCNLPQEIIKKYNIMIATHKVVINGNEIEDDWSAIKPDEFYAEIAEAEQVNSIVSPTAKKYADLFTNGVKNGDSDFIVITMSKRSGESYNAAIAARDSFLGDIRIQGIRIAVIDSKNLSAGYGYLVMLIARLKDKGVTFEDMVVVAEKYKTSIKGYVCVSDALSLSRMGLIKTSQRKIKRITDDIILLGTDNKGVGMMMGHASGMREVCKAYAEEFEKNADTKLSEFLLIEYSSDISRAEELKEYMRREAGFLGEVYISQLPPSGGVSLGLGSVGMAYACASSGEAVKNLFRGAGAVIKTSTFGLI